MKLIIVFLLMVYLRVDLNAEQRLGAALDESSQLALLIGVHGPHSHLHHFLEKNRKTLEG